MATADLDIRFCGLSCALYNFGGCPLTLPRSVDDIGYAHLFSGDGTARDLGNDTVLVNSFDAI